MERAQGSCSTKDSEAQRCHGSTRGMYTNQCHCIYSYILSCLQYYQDANEADVWMNDKAGVAANTDYGANEDKAVNALKKHKVH